MATEEKKSENLNRKQQLVTVSHLKPPYNIRDGVCFVNTDGVKDGNSMLYLLGGHDAGEHRFVQLSYDQNGNGTFEPFNFSNKAPKLENATLSKLVKTKTSLRATSYLVNDAQNGHCIVVMNRFDGYSVYSIDNDKWIVKGNDILEKYNDFARSLLLKQSLADLYVTLVLLFFFFCFILFWCFFFCCFRISNCINER